jgi:hypothetical protein
MTEEQWIEYLRKSKTWNIRMPFELLHSKVYRDLHYCPAVKALNWFYEKVRVEPIDQKKGKKSIN